MDTDFSAHMAALAYAYGAPSAAARLRTHLEDFQVDEILGFAADGEGEHVLVQVRKRNSNTEWVAKQLARFCEIKPMAVSFAGLKDRQAVTSQWFSVHLGSLPEPDWQAFASDEFSVLQAHRHRRKLRRGTLAGNAFRIVLRCIEGRVDDARLQHIAARGVPNYFAEQRFGHDAGNLVKAAAWADGELKVKDRHLRGLYLSAMRSFLFNRVLSRRVADHCWDSAVPGELMQLHGSRSVFAADLDDSEIPRRLAEYDIHPSGPLWGRGERRVTDLARQLEDAEVADYPAFRTHLENAGLEQERRALRVRPENFTWECPDAETLTLSFSLPSGSYATAVVRELARTTAGL